MSTESIDLGFSGSYRNFRQKPPTDFANRTGKLVSEDEYNVVFGNFLKMLVNNGLFDAAEAYWVPESHEIYYEKPDWYGLNNFLQKFDPNPERAFTRYARMLYPSAMAMTCAYYSGCPLATAIRRREQARDFDNIRKWICDKFGVPTERISGLPVYKALVKLGIPKEKMFEELGVVARFPKVREYVESGLVSTPSEYAEIVQHAQTAQSRKPAVKRRL